MKPTITKLLMFLATSIAVLTLAAGCEAPEYEEDDRYSVAPEVPLLRFPIMTTSDRSKVHPEQQCWKRILKDDFGFITCLLLPPC